MLNNKYVQWFLARIEEPSTWAGTGVVALLLKSTGVIPDDVANNILALGAAVGGLLAIVLPEKEPVNQVTPPAPPAPAPKANKLSTLKATKK